MLGLIDVRQESTRLFSSIAIETGAACNRSCVFCPCFRHARPDEFMSRDMFKNIIADLVQLNYSGRVELYIYNEPMRDDRLVDWIRYVRDELKRSCIMISTNGDYIHSSEDIHDLLDAGLNQLLINVYSKGRWKVLNSIVDMVKEERDDVGDHHLYYNIGARKKTVQIASKYAVKSNSGFTSGHMTNRAGNIPWFVEPLPAPLRKVCTRPFRFLNISWAGDAMICCNDYYGDVDIGNVSTRSLEDIWNSSVFNLYRLKLQNKDRRLPLCDVCDFAGGHYAHSMYHVTFGKDMDSRVLAADLRKHEDLDSILLS